MPAHLSKFLARTGFADTWSLHRWSIEHSDDFWRELASFASLPQAGTDFNFAEILLRGDGHQQALLFRNELGERTEWTRDELRQWVATYAALMLKKGLQPGDRVAAYLPNRPETIALMLAAASIGAIWSSCSPDFGLEGVIDRFGQIEPKLLFSTAHYSFAGKSFELRGRLDQIKDNLKTLKEIILVEDIETNEAILAFTRLPHRHPLFILYSSGTTGAPKCIVHSAGGTLVQIVKEHLLHVDLRPNERLFYYTTCGWMMWNWLAVGLASGATLVLYDGSPMYPDPGVLWRMAEADSITHFGTSAKYLASLEKSGYRPAQHHDLSALRQVISTGSPLAPESFDYVWRDIKPGISVASISGGTDIVSCFVLGNPLLPVHRGELQCAGLGMDVQVWNAQGERVWDIPGELVCTNQFPSMPLGFWNDPDGIQYRGAYFDRFPGTWHHGDWATQNSSTLGFVIHGRSDNTLNPGGIRIGTAEIYRQVETIPEIEDCVAVAQEWRGDQRIVLFVKLREHCELTPELIHRIQSTLRTQASPHHVPKKILAVSAIPRTVSGKISESAVRDAIHGRNSANLSALANPECVKEFQARLELLYD